MSSTADSNEPAASGLSGSGATAPLSGLKRLRRRYITRAVPLLLVTVALFALGGTRQGELQTQLQRLHDSGAQVQAKIVDKSNHNCNPRECLWVGEFVVPAPAGPYTVEIGYEPWDPPGTPAQAFKRVTTTFWYDPAAPGRGTYYARDGRLHPAGEFASTHVLGIPVGPLVLVAIGACLVGGDCLRIWSRIWVAGTKRPVRGEIVGVKRAWPRAARWRMYRLIVRAEGSSGLLSMVADLRRAPVVGDQILLSRQGRFAVLANSPGTPIGIAEWITETEPMSVE